MQGHNPFKPNTECAFHLPFLCPWCLGGMLYYKSRSPRLNVQQKEEKRPQNKDLLLSCQVIAEVLGATLSKKREITLTSIMELALEPKTVYLPCWANVQVQMTKARDQAGDP